MLDRLTTQHECSGGPSKPREDCGPMDCGQLAPSLVDSPPVPVPSDSSDHGNETVAASGAYVRTLLLLAAVAVAAGCAGHGPAHRAPGAASDCRAPDEPGCERCCDSVRGRCEIHRAEGFELSAPDKEHWYNNVIDAEVCPDDCRRCARCSRHLEREARLVRERGRSSAPSCQHAGIPANEFDPSTPLAPIYPVASACGDLASFKAVVFWG